MLDKSSNILFPALLLLCGIALCLLQSGLSGFIEIPGDLGDTRFNNYLLEYSYNWISNSTLDNNFWNAPFYFPQPNVIAYSDTLLGVAPIYWVFRFLGLNVAHSLLCWIAAVGILNFVCAMALFRNLPGVTNNGAALGAFLFSFASSRLSHFSHIQLLPQFYAVLALLFFYKALIHRNSCFLYLQIAALSFGLQCYSSFYLSWFTAFVFCLSLLLILTVSKFRTFILDFAKANWFAILACLATLALISTPLAIQYLSAGRTLGLRSPQEVISFTPALPSLLYHGPAHLLYSSIFSSYRDTYGSHEHQFGFGVFSLLLALAGLLALKDRALRYVALCTIAICFLLTVKLPYNTSSAWIYLSDWIPAAEAIRAIGRIHLVLLMIWGFGIASIASKLSSLLPNKVMLNFCMSLLTLTLVTEQARRHTSYSWVEAQKPLAILSDAISAAPDNCKTFFYASTGGKLSPWKYHLDMMWAGLQSNAAVINGYSGNSPPDWPLYHAKINTQQDKLLLGQALKSWSRKHGLSADSTCWLLPANSAPLMAVPLSKVALSPN